MIDHHVHLWAHGEPAKPFGVDDIARYWRVAQARGLQEFAITEHLFRFTNAAHLLEPLLLDFEGKAELRSTMSAYWSEHQGANLDNYVEVLLQAQARGIPVLIGLEVDYYRGQMDQIETMLAAYPFDILLGSVHWMGNWMFDYLESKENMAQWELLDIDEVWERYGQAVEELVATGTCDVLAHPDLIKVTGRRSSDPQATWDRIVRAVSASNMVAEVSSAGLRKPIREQYPAKGLLKKFSEAGVPIATASDAHRIENVGEGISNLLVAVKEAGYDRLSSFRRRRRVEILMRPQRDEGAQSDLL